MRTISIILTATLVISCSAPEFKYNISVQPGKGWIMRGGNVFNNNVSNSPLINCSFPVSIWDYSTEGAFPPFCFVANEDYLFVSSYSGHLIGLNLQTGKSIGNFKKGKSISSSPILYNNNIYYITFDKNSSYIQCFNVSFNSVVWSRTIPFSESSPIIYNNNIITTSRNGFTYMFESQTGKYIWSYKPSTSKNFFYITSAVIFNNYITLTNSGGGIILLDINGNNKKEITLPGAICSTPSVNNNLLYVNCDDLYSYCIDTNLEIRWKSYLGTKSNSSLTFYKETIITAGIDGRVFCIDKDGKIKWVFATQGAIVATPILTGDMILIGSYNKFLYCFNAEDGNLIWKKEFDAPIISGVIVINKFIIVASSEKKIFGLKCE
ncbi:MAG: PQQ-binding-like beta-propeller repeat protein [Ignavibacteria bacterium]